LVRYLYGGVLQVVGHENIWRSAREVSDERSSKS
jgi:hypothetical protein